MAWALEAQIFLVRPVDTARHVLDHEVKSVTRHAVTLVRLTMLAGRLS